MHPSLAALIEKPIAHRGLHDGNIKVIENTRSAFAAAIAHGYGIELDLQLSACGDAMVFHDETMDRLTELSGPVRHHSTDLLSQTPKGSGDDTAETLADILAFVAGREPVVIEMKDNGEHNDVLARAVAETVAEYHGAVSVMSFSQDLLRHMREENVLCPVGLTAEGTDPKSFAVHREAFDIGIDFVSYDVRALPNLFVKEARDRSLPVITWTVRTPEDAALTYRHADQITFEGFLP